MRMLIVVTLLATMASVAKAQATQPELSVDEAKSALESAKENCDAKTEASQEFKDAQAELKAATEQRKIASGDEIPATAQRLLAARDAVSSMIDVAEAKDQDIQQARKLLAKAMAAEKKSREDHADDDYRKLVQQARDDNEAKDAAEQSAAAAEQARRNAAEAEERAEMAKMKELIPIIPDFKSVHVEITSVRLGQVQYVDPVDGPGQEPATRIVIGLHINNRSGSKKISYHTWGTMDFSDSDVATAHDDIGNTYKRINFGFHVEVVGRDDEKSLYPGDSANDLLVFEEPVVGAKWIEITVPGSNVDADDITSPKIKLPIELIDHGYPEPSSR